MGTRSAPCTRTPRPSGADSRGTRARRSLAPGFRSRRTPRARRARTPAAARRSRARSPRRACAGCRARPGRARPARAGGARRLQRRRSHDALAQSACRERTVAIPVTSRAARVATAASAGGGRHPARRRSMRLPTPPPACRARKPASARREAPASLRGARGGRAHARAQARSDDARRDMFAHRAGRARASTAPRLAAMNSRSGTGQAELPNRCRLAGRRVAAVDVDVESIHRRRNRVRDLVDPIEKLRAARRSRDSSG